eukprot:2194756-Prymnesium_polylepis.2
MHKAVGGRHPCGESAECVCGVCSVSLQSEYAGSAKSEGEESFIRNTRPFLRTFWNTLYPKRESRIRLGPDRLIGHRSSRGSG